MNNLNRDIYQKPEFSVRIVVCDHYLTKPAPGIDVIYSDFRGSDIKQVPVLRIFGPTPEGRKTCLHIHGVFPYFYIPCPTSNPEPQFLYQIAASLDKAINIALKQATSTNQHVYKISLVKGLPFYGFHDKDHLFLKVFLYSPGLIKQAVELCSNGAILGQPFQPHESHLNFTLQFFIDFNLFGMSNIDLQFIKFRKSGLFQGNNEILHDENEFSLKPESACYYEADCTASHIINRQRIGRGDGIENPGLEEVWNQEIERRKQLNLSIASKSLSQRRIEGEETESHYKFEQVFRIKMSLNLIDKPENIEQEIKKMVNALHYPAESMEGSQLLNAVDVSMHLPETSLGITLSDTLRINLDETCTEDINNTIVDENLALNSSLSLHYSQVLLNTEDLELLDVLQDMDGKPIKEDGIMGTPANMDNNAEIESDDEEYSQAFDENTLFLKPCESEDEANENSPIWNDTFWNNVYIPQLDGTCDDDHVKKVRKRKMRPFKLGLSKPKAKKKNTLKLDEDSKIDTTEKDEINASRDTIDDISDLHIRRAVKTNSVSIVEKSKVTHADDTIHTSELENASIADLVNKVSSNHETCQLGAAENYDLQKRYQPMAGPSHSNFITTIISPTQDDDNVVDTNSSSEDNKLGIMSFYNTSKIFNVSMEDSCTNQDASRQKPPIQSKSKTEHKIVKQKRNLKNITENFISQLNIYDLKNTTFKILTPKIKPPTKKYVICSLEQHDIPKVVNNIPYYSDYKDVGDKVEIGQMTLKLLSKLSQDQKPFEKILNTTSLEEWRHLIFLQTNDISQESAKPDVLKALLASNKHCILETINKPPTGTEVKKWLKQEHKLKLNENKINHTDQSKVIDELDNSQALGLNEDMYRSASLNNKDKEKTDMDSTLHLTMQPNGSFLCFGSNENDNDFSSVESNIVDVNFLTLMLLEVHTSIRGELHPDPAVDAIQAIFVKVKNDCPNNHFLPQTETEILVVDDVAVPKYLNRCVFNVHVSYVASEREILEKVIELVKKHDPDIMCGYEIEMNSWGYIFERSHVLGMDILKDVSRITETHRQKRWRSEENDYEGRIIGRVIFNVWRLFRHELALSSYSFENCMYEILKERVPKYSYAQLAKWWCDDSRILRWITVEHFLMRLSGTVRMLEKLDIINRTSELARLFGLQWWEVLSRGSQFRVESLMLRAARPLNLVALSPTVKQRATMRAPECLPLIFEPESRYYSDPVIVLDFQSLYPSMMIAYNYCFSTCIGRVQNINRFSDTAYEFGAWHLRVSKSKLEGFVEKGLVHWSPVGVGFVKPTVRRGVLPALLRRILATRQAVKKNMKLQTDEAVKKAMHSRQLGLKLIANVTYGYTAANFSGRMPCVEVGDSVVAKGRETLERAIKLVQNNTKWNAKVVYGDTDSMFVVIPGGTRAEAFEIGLQIADAVTADNPSPVALKLEKVYQPCILQTKKRYVGYMYESPDQENPVYEAKGIETVRRDGCPAGVKLLQQSLCELFSTGDMSAVKRRVQATLARLARGSLPAHELFFTREYRGPAGYRPGASAPPNEIAKRIMSSDRRAAPRIGWRVSWLVTAGARGAALVRLAREPHELARRPAPPHVAYYAARVLLPPLHRALSLLGVDVFKWWTEISCAGEAQHTERIRGGIARYMWRERCAVCGGRGAGRDAGAVCARCVREAGEQRVAAAFVARLNAANAHVQYCTTICVSCCGHAYALKCENTECPVFWRRLSSEQKLSQIKDVVTHLPLQFARENLDF